MRESHLNTMSLIFPVIVSVMEKPNSTEKISPYKLSKVNPTTKIKVYV